MKQRITRAALLTLAYITYCSTSIAQQAVSAVVTDYNGFWKSSSIALNSSKPQNSHNLLAFTYNSVQYSTGVNDGLLTSRGETFTPGDFWCLPIANISGVVNSNTKIGLGQLYDGVNNGASYPAPDGDLVTYLTDGIKGLGIGTCIANLPAGTMSFFVSNIKPSHIGDGIPDIIVTQVADPSNSFDRYAFTNADGQVIGQTKDVVFTNITPVANWTADFYEASQTPIVLTSGFTNTDRPMRLWAADLSDFGITADNYETIARFRITLSGNSDVAFAAYNNKTFTINSNVLPVSWGSFSGRLNQTKAYLSWSTESETNTRWFVVEKSEDRQRFVAVDSVAAAGESASTISYQWTDNRSLNKSSYFRIRLVNLDGSYSYSSTVLLKGTNSSIVLECFPNPVLSSISIRHPGSTTAQLQLSDISGRVLLTQKVTAGATSSILDMHIYPTGLYQISFQTAESSHSIQVLKK